MPGLREREERNLWLILTGAPPCVRKFSHAQFSNVLSRSLQFHSNHGSTVFVEDAGAHRRVRLRYKKERKALSFIVHSLVRSFLFFCFVFIPDSSSFFPSYVLTYEDVRPSIRTSRYTLDSIIKATMHSPLDSSNKITCIFLFV